MVARIFSARPSGEPYKNPTIGLPALINLSLTDGSLKVSGQRNLSVHGVIVKQIEEFQKQQYRYAAENASAGSSATKLTWRLSAGGRTWPYDTGKSSRILQRTARDFNVRGGQILDGRTSRFTVFPTHRRDNFYLTEIERLGRAQSRAAGDAGGRLPATRILRRHAREFMDESRGNLQGLADQWALAVDKELEIKGIRL